MAASRPALRRLVAVAAVLTIGLTACSGKSDRPINSPGSSTPTVPTSGTATTGPATPSPTAVASLQSRTASLSLPVARYATAGAAIGNDLYVLGGLDAPRAPSRDVYRVEPAAPQGTPAGHPSTPTSRGTPLASDGEILLFGRA